MNVIIPKALFTGWILGWEYDSDYGIRHALSLDLYKYENPIQGHPDYDGRATGLLP
jgi:hypothetical protein